MSLLAATQGSLCSSAGKPAQSNSATPTHALGTHASDAVTHLHTLSTMHAIANTYLRSLVRIVNNAGSRGVHHTSPTPSHEDTYAPPHISNPRCPSYIEWFTHRLHCLHHSTHWWRLLPSPAPSWCPRGPGGGRSGWSTRAQHTSSSGPAGAPPAHGEAGRDRVSKLRPAHAPM